MPGWDHPACPIQATGCFQGQLLLVNTKQWLVLEPEGFKVEDLHRLLPVLLAPHLLSEHHGTERDPKLTRNIALVSVDDAIFFPQISNYFFAGVFFIFFSQWDYNPTETTKDSCHLLWQNVIAGVPYSIFLLEQILYVFKLCSHWCHLISECIYLWK